MAAILKWVSAIFQAIQGQADGAHFIRDLREFHSDPDALFCSVQALSNLPASIHGFCRELQKHIELERTL